MTHPQWNKRDFTITASQTSPVKITFQYGSLSETQIDQAQENLRQPLVRYQEILKFKGMPTPIINKKLRGKIYVFDNSKTFRDAGYTGGGRTNYNAVKKEDYRWGSYVYQKRGDTLSTIWNLEHEFAHGLSFFLLGNFNFERYPFFTEGFAEYLAHGSQCHHLEKHAKQYANNNEQLAIQSIINLDYNSQDLYSLGFLLTAYLIEGTPTRFVKLIEELQKTKINGSKISENTLPTFIKGKQADFISWVNDKAQKQTSPCSVITEDELFPDEEDITEEFNQNPEVFSMPTTPIQGHTLGKGEEIISPNDVITILEQYECAQTILTQFNIMPAKLSKLLENKQPDLLLEIATNLCSDAVLKAVQNKTLTSFHAVINLSASRRAQLEETFNQDKAGESSAFIKTENNQEDNHSIQASASNNIELDEVVCEIILSLKKHSNAKRILKQFQINSEDFHDLLQKNNLETCLKICSNLCSSAVRQAVENGVLDAFDDIIQLSEQERAQLEAKYNQSTMDQLPTSLQILKTLLEKQWLKSNDNITYEQYICLTEFTNRMEEIQADYPNVQEIVKKYQPTYILTEPDGVFEYYFSKKNQNNQPNLIQLCQHLENLVVFLTRDAIRCEAIIQGATNLKQAIVDYQSSCMLDKAKAGDWIAVMQHLEGDVNPNIQDSENKPLLLLALEDNHLSHTDYASWVIQALLNKGANPNINLPNYSQLTLLENEYREKHWDNMSLLIEHGADITAINLGHGHPLLYYALFADRQFAIARCILKQAIQTDHQEMLEAYSLLLIKAIRQDRPDVLKLLLEEGINPNTQDEEGEYALILACDRGNFDCIRILLDTKGIEVNVQAGQTKNTPLHILIQHNWHQPIKHLILRGARADIPNEAGEKLRDLWVQEDWASYDIQESIGNTLHVTDALKNCYGLKNREETSAWLLLAEYLCLPEKKEEAIVGIKWWILHELNHTVRAERAQAKRGKEDEAIPLIRRKLPQEITDLIAQELCTLPITFMHKAAIGFFQATPERKSEVIEMLLKCN